MAVLTEYSVEWTQLYVTVPATPLYTTEQHGVVRCAYVSHAFSGAGDIGSSVALFKLPPGRVRLLGALSRLYVNWTTAAATLSLGWDAYTDLDGAAVAADADGLVDALDVDAVGFRTFEGALAAELLTGGTHLFKSKGGVTIRATSETTAVISGDDIDGCFYYVQD